MAKANSSKIKGTLKRIDYLQRIGTISKTQKVCIHTVFDNWSNIVHCKDCSYYWDEDSLCAFFMNEVEENAYCSYGCKMKNDENEIGEEK